MQKDREGFDSHILRFSARLVIDGKVDVKRKFVVAYFLSDDNILVTLVPEENSGTYLFNIINIKTVAGMDVICLGVACLGVACLGVACLGVACLGVAYPD